MSIDTSDNESLYNPRVDTGEAESTRYFAFDPLVVELQNLVQALWV